MPQAYLDSLDVNKGLSLWQKDFQENANTRHNLFIAEKNGTLVGFACSGEGRAEALKGKGEFMRSQKSCKLQKHVFAKLKLINNKTIKP